MTVPGFSAGSYSGLCLLHLLWNLPHVRTDGKLGGIALPPALLHNISKQQGKGLMLFHYKNDSLCQWNADESVAFRLPCNGCFVSNTYNDFHDHFGKSGHSYGHWLRVDLPEGFSRCGPFFGMFLTLPNLSFAM